MRISTVETGPFSQQLESMRQWMLDLSRRSGEGPTSDDSIPEVLERLGTALEELSVTGEEIRQQEEELIRTRKAIEVERQRYRDLFENAPEAYLVTDPEGVIQETNLGGAALLGMPRESLTGKPLVLFIAPGDRAAFHIRLAHLQRERRSEAAWEFALQPEAGPPFSALFTVHQIETFSGLGILRWTVRRVSSHRPVPDVARGRVDLDPTLAALGRMAARIVQHLDGEMSTILDAAENLGASNLAPEARGHLNTLEVAVSNVAEIIRRMQAFSRLRPTAPLEPTDLAALVRQALEATRFQRQARGIQCRVELDGLPRVLGQAAEIREAVIHLIMNAVEAMPGGGTLTLSTRSGQRSPAPGDSPARWADLTLTDTGAGMSEEVCRQLFEPFFTTKGLTRGGLGLAMVYGIVRRHRGSVEVSSAPGRGSTVTLWFEVAGDPSAGAPFPSGRRPEALRILLIDNNEMVRKTLAALLRRQGGHVVIEAGSGTEGLERLSEASVDLVLSDLEMPAMNGWEVAQAIKARRPTLPVIVLTGWGEAAPDLPPGPCPVDRVVAKSIAQDHLLAVIAELLASGKRCDR